MGAVNPIRRYFPHEPTAGQARLFEALMAFLTDPTPKTAFLLRGYAGTGKTTAVAALTKAVRQMGWRVVMLAPTGRAAKVMAQYARRRAFTIHKHIYQQVADPATGALRFVRRGNEASQTLYIVDEASMIADEADYGTRGLLTDLVSFVYEQPTNKLMLIGDTAQLPPVRQSLSPALNPTTLADGFGLHLSTQELTEVTRQQRQSGILSNATDLREQIRRGQTEVTLRTGGFADVYRMTGARLQDGLTYAYDKYGLENTIVLCRSNRAAVEYNKHVRFGILGREEELSAGDLLMIVRNNYRTLGEGDKAGFLANGDFVEVQQVRREEEMHGFRFANAVLRLLDYPEQPPFEAKVLLDTLHGHSPALTTEENRRLYEAVVQDYADVRSESERREQIRADPYLNALQVKFAYALTCHKAQGGQWPAVFVDQGYLTEEMVHVEFLRWLYTALTRATHELFLVNFHARFFNSR